jgi:hypothetical protein
MEEKNNVLSVHESYMQFKFRCPLIKGCGLTATIHFLFVYGCFQVRETEVE